MTSTIELFLLGLLLLAISLGALICWAEDALRVQVVRWWRRRHDGEDDEEA